MLSQKYFRTLLIIFLVFILYFLSPLLGGKNNSSIENNSLENFISKINMNNIKEHINYFGSLNTRYTGYNSTYLAIRYIYEKLYSYGLKPFLENFTVLVPVEKRCELKVEVEGKSYQFTVHTFVPNLVQTSPTPLKGLSGRLIYVGDGGFKNIDGLNLTNSIALIKYNSGYNWLRLHNLGVKAAIFIEPYSTNRLESFNKFVYVNLYFPRVLIDRKSGLFLKEIVCSNKNVKANLIIQSSLEEKISSNIIVFIEGSEHPENTLVLAAYIDDWSPVPAIVPHKDSASGASVLLEISRLFSIYRPKMSVVIVFFTGHWQALAGPRAFIEEILEYFADKSISFHPIWNKTRPKFFLSLDLSTGSRDIAIIHSGGFYHISGPPVLGRSGQMYDGVYRLIQLEWRKMLENLIIKKCGYNIRIYYQMYDQPEGGDTFIESGESEYFTAIPYKYIADVEPWLQAGLPGYTLFTANDYRFSWFIPIEDRFNFENLIPQIYYAFSLSYLLANIFAYLYPPERTWGPTRFYFPEPFAPYVPGFTIFRGEVVEYNPLSPRQYEAFNKSCIVVIRDTEDRYNIFNYIFLKTLANGSFTVYGLGHHRGASPRVYEAKIYVINYSDGKIYYTNDLGRYGAKVISTTQAFQVRAGRYGWPYPVRFAVFETAQLVLLDLSYPQGFLDLCSTRSIYETKQFKDINIIIRDFESKSDADHFGYEIDHITGTLIAYVEPEVACEIEIYIRSQEGPIMLSVLLLNNSKAKPEGNGYILKKSGEYMLLNFSIQHYIKNLYYLSKSRIDVARKYDVYDAVSERSLRYLNEFMEKTYNASKKMKWSEIYYSSLLAWAWSQKLYISSRNLIQGSSTTTITYFLLLIPFAFVLERLLFEFIEGRKRMVAILLVIIVFISVLGVLHPGFQLVSNIATLYLGFTILIVSFIVAFLLFMDFKGVLSKIRRKRLGEHFVEVSRWDMMVYSLYYGVVNIKRHKYTSSLTIIAVVLMTISMVSLTSVVPYIITKVISMGSGAPFDGLVIRYVDYSNLPQRFVETISYLINENKTSLRVWLYSPIMSSGLFGETIVYSENSSSTIKAFLGIDKGESSRVQKIIFQGYANDLWMKYTENIIPCLISLNTAQDLKISRIPSHIKIWGIDFLVVGIFDPTAAADVMIDIDLKEITPINIWEMTQEKPIGTEPHIEWNNIIIVPTEKLIKFPGSIKSSYCIFSNRYEKISDTAKILSEMAVNMYLMVSRKSYVTGYLAYAGLAGIGWSTMLPPVILVSLIIFNMMFSLVYQRQRDTKILSSIGLAPLHVIGLFLAEAVTYALIASVIGYTIGILILKLLVPVMGPSFYPNYASSMVIIAIALSFVTTILPSIIPAIKIGSLVTPSFERKWRISTKPRENTWIIPTPIRAKKEEIIGLLLYIKEFLDEYRIERAHKTFASIDMAKLATSEIEGKKSIILRTKVMLYPWEAGLKQIVEVLALPEDTFYRITVSLKLFEGPRDVWIRSNRLFLDVLRKQLLLWRSLTPKNRKKYIERGKKYEGD